MLEEMVRVDNMTSKLLKFETPTGNSLVHPDETALGLAAAVACLEAVTSRTSYTSISK